MNFLGFLIIYLYDDMNRAYIAPSGCRFEKIREKLCKKISWGQLCLQESCIHNIVFSSVNSLRLYCKHNGYIICKLTCKCWVIDRIVQSEVSINKIMSFCERFWVFSSCVQNCTTYLYKIQSVVVNLRETICCNATLRRNIRKINITSNMYASVKKFEVYIHHLCTYI